MYLIKAALLLILISLASGCTPSDNLKTDNYTDYKQYSFKIIDQRPEIEKDNEILSISTTNCAYGIYRIGDNNTTPDRISYLKNKLQHHRSISLKNQTIKIKKFTIHKNLQNHLRNSNIYRNILVSSFECDAKTDEPGGFSLMENPAKLPAAVIEVTLEIAGRSKTYRAVHAGYIEQGLVTTTDDLIPTAMDKVITDIINSLKS